MFVGNIELEKVSIEPESRGGSHRKNSVWLSGKPKPNRTSISSDLVEKLGWKAGDKINLYRVKGNSKIFVIKREASTIKLQSDKSGDNTRKSLYIQSKAFASSIFPTLNGLEYEAWIEGNCLWFKAPTVKEQQEAV